MGAANKLTLSFKELRILPARHIALGLDGFFPAEDEFEHFLLKPGDRVLVYSDGLTESRNADGEEFGEQRLNEVIDANADVGTVFDQIVSASEEFSQGCPQHDDITVVEIPFIEAVLGILGHVENQPSMEMSELMFDDQAVDSFKTSLALQGKRLAQVEMIPLLMNELQENQLSQDVLSEVYTVLAELHANALDHGVLGLDSAMKQGEDGFMEYFSERERRLSELQEGHVSIDIQIYWHANGGRMIIKVEDSGAGFALNHVGVAGQDDAAEHGRGLGLVRALCHSLRYEEPGNKVEAVYTWTE